MNLEAIVTEYILSNFLLLVVEIAFLETSVKILFVDYFQFDEYHAHVIW